MAENQSNAPQTIDPLTSSDGLTTDERNKQRDNDRMNAEAADKAAGLNVFAFFLALFFNKDADILKDENAINEIADTFSIDTDVFKNIINNFLDGDINGFQAAYRARSNVNDTSSVDWDRANHINNYGNLNNLPPTKSANFIEAVDIVLKLEGGWNPNEPDGAVANFGINSKANPDIDVRNLTQNKAVALYETRYWDKINGIEKMDLRAATIAFDLAVNSGPGRANQFLKELEQEGKANLQTGEVDISALMQKREEYYDSLVQGNPAKFAQYADGWNTRLSHLTSAVEQMPASRTQLAANFDTAKAASEPLQGTSTANLTTQFGVDGNGGVSEITEAPENTPAGTQLASVTPAAAAPAT